MDLRLDEDNCTCGSAIKGFGHLTQLFSTIDTKLVKQATKLEPEIMRYGVLHVRKMTFTEHMFGREIKGFTNLSPTFNDKVHVCQFSNRNAERT